MVYFTFISRIVSTDSCLVNALPLIIDSPPLSNHATLFFNKNKKYIYEKYMSSLVPPLINPSQRDLNGRMCCHGEMLIRIDFKQSLIKPHNFANQTLPHYHPHTNHLA